MQRIPSFGLGVECVGELRQNVNELLDLSLRIGGRDLDPETDLAFRHERARGEGHVHAVVEEETARRIDVLMAKERDLDDRKTRTIGGVDTEPIEALKYLIGLAPEACANCIASCLVHVEAGEHCR